MLAKTTVKVNEPHWGGLIVAGLKSYWPKLNKTFWRAVDYQLGGTTLAEPSHTGLNLISM